jgi:hypothetical protein
VTLRVQRWIISLWMRRDIRRIVRDLPPGDRERLRTMPESELILLHHDFGRGLRNAFRSNRFRGLSTYCHAEVQRSGEPLSFDALSSVAIRLIWATLQTRMRMSLCLSCRSPNKALKPTRVFWFAAPLVKMIIWRSRARGLALSR